MLSFLSTLLLFSVTLPLTVTAGSSGTQVNPLQSRQANTLGCVPLTALLPGATTVITRRRQGFDCTGTCTTGGYQYSAIANSGSTCICSNTLDSTQLVAANTDGTCPAGTVEVINNNVLASVTASLATATTTALPASLTATDDAFFTLESLLSSLSISILGTSALPTAAPTSTADDALYTLDSLVSSLSTQIVNAAPTASASSTSVPGGTANPVLSLINDVLGGLLGNGGSSSSTSSAAGGTISPSASLTATDDALFTLASFLSSLSTEILGTSTLPTAVPTNAVEGVFYTLDSIVSSLSTQIVAAIPTASASVTSGTSGTTNPLLSLINGLLGDLLGNGGPLSSGTGSLEPLLSALSSASTEFYGHGGIPTSVAGANPLESFLSSLSTHVLGTSTLAPGAFPTFPAGYGPVIGEGGLIPADLPLSLDLLGIPLIGHGGAATPSPASAASSPATTSSAASSVASSSPTSVAPSSSASQGSGIPLIGEGGLIPIDLPFSLDLGTIPVIGGSGPAAAPTSSFSSSATPSIAIASGSTTITTGSPTSTSGTTGSATSTQTAPAPTYTPLGCYTEPPEHDGITVALTNYTTGPQSDMTVELCVSTCAGLGYPLAGVEFGDDCYCGDGTYNGGHPDPVGNCTTPCSGNPSEICGGNYLFNLYADETFLNTFYAKFPAAKYHSTKRSWPRFTRRHYPA